MKINWLEYRNKNTGSTIKRIIFPQTCLLSTEQHETIDQLLTVIKEARGFALGSTKTNFSGAILRINFTIDQLDYMWFLKVVDQPGLTISHDNPLSYSNLPRIFEEELYNHEDQLVFQRVYEKASINEISELPLVNPSFSLLHLFNHDEQLQKIVSGFARVFVFSTYEDCCFEMDYEKYQKYLSLCEDKYNIAYQPVVTPLKLGLLEKLNPSTFSEIKSIFISIYPEFSDLKIDTLFDNHLYSLYILVDNDWLNCLQITGNQFATLNLLINLYSIPDHSVAIINDLSCNENLSKVIEQVQIKRPSLQLILNTKQPVSTAISTITLSLKNNTISNQ